MAILYPGSGKFTYNLDVQAPKPFDSRLVVASYENDLAGENYKTTFILGGANAWYNGMVVYAEDTKKLYVLKGDEGFVEVGPELPENATKNTTYDLSAGVNTAKGEIKLHDNDADADDIVYVEGDSTNIKVSSDASGIKVEHIVPTEGTALVAAATQVAPGLDGTFTAVTGLKKDANGHIVEATLETIKLPGEQDLSGYKTKQTAVADVTATGTDVTTVVTSVTQNENGEITVTKGTIPAESADVDSLDGKTGVITTLKDQTAIGSINLEVDSNNQLKATLVGSFEDDADVNVLEGVKVNGTALTIGTGKAVDWKLIYNSDAKKLQVLDLNNSNAVVNEVDATDFIKDGMLSSGELVWCTINEKGGHVPATAETEGAIQCLKLTLHVWERGQVDENGDPIYTEQYVHIPLGSLCDPYAGTEGEIDVVEEHGKHVIKLAEAKAEATFGEAQTPAHGGSFSVITGVSTDNYGRVSSVETTQVTLPECAEIGDGTQTGSDDYVSVTVSTTGGVVSRVTVNTDSLTEKIEEIETVTSAALNDLNVRVSGIEAEYVKSVTSEEEALNNSSYVSVHAATEDGRVTLTSTVEAVEATDTVKYPSTGLATDGYVKEQIASVSAVSGTAVQNIKSEGQTITVERQAGSNDVNLELMWAWF